MSEEEKQIDHTEDPQDPTIETSSEAPKEEENSVPEKIVQKKKNRLANVIFWLAIIAVLFACVYVIFTLKSNEAMCLQNGFVYAANNQMHGEVVECSCTEIKNGEYYPFAFNKSSWWATPVERSPFAFGS